jgi:hypothetical protein
MRVYRVHVPTLSVDGLIRTYGTHCTTLNIYNLQNSCFIFYATRFTLLLAIFLVPPTPNSKARYMYCTCPPLQQHKRYFVVTDAANGSLPPRLFPITTLQHFKTTNQIFIDQQHARSIVKFTAILRS